MGTGCLFQMKTESAFVSAFLFHFLIINVHCRTQILPCLFLAARSTQQVRGVIRHDERNPATGNPEYMRLVAKRAKRDFAAGIQPRHRLRSCQAQP